MKSWRLAGIYVLSLFVALVLQFIQLPMAVAPAWPAWTLLVLTAWCVNLPRFPHFLAALVLGLALDVGTSSVLGAHALALLLAVYMAMWLSPRVATLPGWQRGTAFTAVWVVNAGVLSIADHLAHHPAVASLRWGPVVAVIILWPFVNRWVARLVMPRRAAVS